MVFYHRKNLFASVWDEKSEKLGAARQALPCGRKVQSTHAVILSERKRAEGSSAFVAQYGQITGKILRLRAPLRMTTFFLSSPVPKGHLPQNLTAFRRGGRPRPPGGGGLPFGKVMRIRKALPGKSRRPSPTMQIKRWQIPSYSGYSQQFKP